MLIKTPEARHNARKHGLSIKSLGMFPQILYFIAFLGNILSDWNDPVYWNTFGLRKHWNRPLFDGSA